MTDLSVRQFHDMGNLFIKNVDSSDSLVSLYLT